MSGAPLEAVGQILSGTYQIERKIAAGGMGVVYEARHVRLPRRFAVKVLGRPSDAVDAEIALERFKREAQVASALKSAHVVQIYDYQVAAGGFPYIVMELLEGEDLAQRLKRVRVAPQLAVRFVAEIADALDTAHAAGVVHRDLKPANVFLSTTPTLDFVKVLDFGVSKMTNQASITRTDALVGTPLYMSPEQAGGAPDLTPVSDVFALGAIAYELLTGARPFAGKSVPAILYQVVHGEPAPPSRSLPAEVRDVDAVFAQALAKDPRLRYATAGRFARALEIAMRPLLPVEAAESAELSGARTHIREPQAPAAISASPLTGPPTPVATPISTPLGAPGAGSGVTPAEPATPPTAARLADAQSEPTRRRAAVRPRAPVRPGFGALRLAIVAAGIVLAAAAATVGFRRGQDEHAKDAERGAAVAVPSASERPPPPPPPRQVEVVVRVSPASASATIFLDDDLLVDGRGAVPWRSQPRRLRVVAPGYLAAERAVDVSMDRNVEVTLRPDPTPRAGRPRR